MTTSFTLQTVTADGDTLQSNNDPDNLPHMQLPKDWKDIKPPSPFMKYFQKWQKATASLFTYQVTLIPPGNPSLAGKRIKFHAYSQRYHG